MKHKHLLALSFGVVSLLALPSIGRADDDEERTRNREKIEIDREVHRDGVDRHLDGDRLEYGDDVKHEREHIEIRKKQTREHEKDD